MQEFNNKEEMESDSVEEFDNLLGLNSSTEEQEVPVVEVQESEEPQDVEDEPSDDELDEEDNVTVKMSEEQYRRIQKTMAKKIPLGDKIKEMREILGLSIGDMCELGKFSMSHYRKMEKNEFSITELSASKLSSIFKVEIPTIFVDPKSVKPTRHRKQLVEERKEPSKSQVKSQNEIMAQMNNLSKGQLLKLNLKLKNMYVSVSKQNIAILDSLNKMEAVFLSIYDAIPGLGDDEEYEDE